MTFQTNFPLQPTKLPYVTVSAKGISNGLSDIPNDGFDFGPDTMLNATSKGQYGPPYSYTSGIQEAINYVFNQGGGEIVLGEGVFELNADYVIQQTDNNENVINIPLNSPNNPIITISIKGSAPPMYDFQKGYNATPAITPTNMKKGTIIYNPTYTSAPGQGAIFGATPSGTDLNNNINIFLTDLTFTTVQPNETNYLPTMLNLSNFAGFYLRNVAVNVNTPTGALNNPTFSGSTGIGVNQLASNNGLAVIDNVYVVNYANGMSFGAVEHLHIKKVFIQYCNVALGFGNVSAYPPNIEYADLEQNTYPVLFNGTFWLFNAKFTIQNSGAYSSTNWSNAQAIFTSWYQGGPVYGEAEVYFNNTNTYNPPLVQAVGSSLSNLYGFVIKEIGLGSPLYPLGSNGTTTAGTTAGSVIQQFVEYRQLHKKLMIQFSGYENDTTTNQTINFPLPFSSYAVITGNNTGLTISASTTGITITAPNSTATYSGIVIVEGY